jgi:uncharacterized membrane protein
MHPPLETDADSVEQGQLAVQVDDGWSETSPRGGFGWENGDSLRALAERRATQLGWLSLGLGISAMAAPSGVSRLVGLPDGAARRTAVRAIGAREIVSAFGLFANPRSAAPVWARVAGDAIDLTLLGVAFGNRRARPVRLAAAAAAVLGIMTLDVYSAARLSRKDSVQRLVLPIHVVKSITIQRAPETVYQFWRDLENLPRFMAHLEAVREDADGSVWRAKGPLGTTIEWRAEITLDRPNEALAWRSLEGTQVPNRGVVRFKPGPAGKGTELTVELKYEPPAGALGAAFAKLFGEEPGQQIAGDLRRLKQVLETGGVVHSDASIHRGRHPARPPADNERTHVLGSPEQDLREEQL